MTGESLHPGSHSILWQRIHRFSYYSIFPSYVPSSSVLDNTTKFRGTRLLKFDGYYGTVARYRYLPRSTQLHRSHSTSMITIYRTAGLWESSSFLVSLYIMMDNRGITAGVVLWANTFNLLAWVRPHETRVQLYRRLKVWAFISSVNRTYASIFTLHACARGKAIGFVCCLSVVCCRHENRQIATSRHLRQVRRICRHRR